MSKNKIHGELKDSDTKVKITAYIDGDIILAIKKKAEAEGLKYQSYINAVLKKWVESDQSILNFHTMDQLDEVYKQKFLDLDNQLQEINKKLDIKKEA